MIKGSGKPVQYLFSKESWYFADNNEKKSTEIHDCPEALWYYKNSNNTIAIKKYMTLLTLLSLLQISRFCPLFSSVNVKSKQKQSYTVK